MVFVPGVRATRVDDLFDLSTQHFGYSDEARARQAVLTILVLLDLLKRHPDLDAQFLLRHSFRKAKRSYPLTDDLVQLARYGHSFLHPRRGCRRCPVPSPR